jgi:uncharacterized phage protein (TIGR01671 family)
MRQIKFRAWDKKYKEMINDIHIAPEYDWLVLSDNDALAERDNRGRGDDDGYELMQFTGLLDKNGKEIYEGDVVELNNTKYDIVFIEGEFCGANDNGESIQMFEVINGSVIGNIYEHSELLTNS